MKHRGILSIIAVIAVLSLFLLNKNAIITTIMKAAIIQSADTNIQTYEDDQLRIYYTDGHENIISDIINLLPAMEQEQEKWFPDLQVNEMLPVFILDAHHPLHSHYFQETKKGIYYVDLQLVLLNADAYSPANNFVHEYAHFILDQYVEQKEMDESLLPMWFIEGFANSFEWSITNEASESIAYYESTPFTELTDVTQDNRIEVYSQGFHAVLDLIYRYDHGIIRQIIDETAITGQFDLAFHHQTHLDYITYHEQFTYDREQLRYFHTLAQQNPAQLIIEVEAYLKTHPAVHPLTADLAELLYKAHYKIGNGTVSIQYAQLATSLTRDPFFLIKMANSLGENEPFLKAQCIEKALFFSKLNNTEQEALLQQVNEIANNS